MCRVIMTMRRLLLVLVLVASATAQGPTPVSVGKALSCLRCGGWAQDFSYTNLSDKDIDVIKFRVYFVDEIGDEKQTDIYYTNTSNVKAGKKHTAHAGFGDRQWDYQIKKAMPPNHAELKFVPVKIKFADSTEWTVE